MTNNKATKRALGLSVLSLVLCFSMLLGTTYAWFTDSVSSKNTVITAGNLDVELYHADKGTNGENKPVDDNTSLFDDVDTKKWEPGAMAWEKLTVKNEGNLNLKYQLTLNALNATVVSGISFASVLKVAVVDETFVYTRENVEAIPAEKWSDLATFTLTGNLEGTPEGATENPSKTYGVIIWWQPSDIDNIFNTKDNVSVEVGVTLVATQQIGESDSTGDDYDEDAWHPDMQVYNAQDLQAALNNGVTNIQIMSDIEITESIVVPEGATVMLDLNGFSLSANDSTYAITNLGNLTIFDSKASSGFSLRSRAIGNGVTARGIYNGSEDVTDAKLTILSGNFNAIGATGGAAVFNYGSVEIKGGTFTSLGSYSLNNQPNASMIIDNAVVTGGIYNQGALLINDGEISTNRGGGNHAIYSYGGSIEINGGNFYGNGNEVINANNDVAIINGGTFDKVEKSSYLLAGANMVIYDGNFFAYDENGVDPASHPVRSDVTVYGGTFNYKHTTGIADGFHSVDDGMGGSIIINTEVTNVVFDANTLANALTNGGKYLVIRDFAVDADSTLTVANGTTVELDLNGYTITGVSDEITSNRNMFDVRGTLTVYGGTLTLEHVGANMEWGYSTNVFNVTAGGVLNIKDATVENLGGSDMAFCVHLNNWGEVTLNAEKTKFTSTYVGIRAFNSGYDMNNVTLKDCDVLTGNGCFWVHNYTAADFGGSADKAVAAAARLNLDFTGSTFARTSGSLSLFRFGFTNAVYYDANGNQVVVSAKALQSALDNGATKIILDADITGNVTITQQADVNVVIDGNGRTFTGILTVFGNGRQQGAETLTIKNINFVAAEGAESCILSPDRNAQTPAKYSYSHNVTVENCTFTDPDGVVDCAAIRHGDGGDNDWTVRKCTVDSTMHSLLQVNNVNGKLVIDECTVESKNGANLNSCTNVEMTGCTFNVKGYCVRFGVNKGGNLGEAKSYVFTNNTLQSACDDGDAVIMLRASAVDAVLTLTNTKLIGENDISGATSATTITYNGMIYLANGLYKDADTTANTYYVANAKGLEKLNAMMADQSAGRYTKVVLLDDIDFAGKTWTPVDSHADTSFWLSEIDGQGHTVYNLTINGQAMFKRFSGAGDVVIKDITFDGAKVDSTANGTITANGAIINTSILTVQTYQNLLLDNVDVRNSTIQGGYKVAPLIATVYNEKDSSITATLRNCDVSDTTVIATKYDFFTCGLVAFVYTTNNDYVEYENCTITNVSLEATSGGYNYHANIHYTSADTDDQINEHPGVTVTNVTFKNR